MFAGFTAISAAWYFIRGRKAFTGPPVESDADPAAPAGELGDRQDLEKIPSH